MKNIDLSNLCQIILDGIFYQELDKPIRKDILDNVPEEHYEMACEVFNEAHQIYFEQGFINNRYHEEKDNQARIDVVEDVHLMYRNTASEVFEATRIAYFDLGIGIRKLLKSI